MARVPCNYKPPLHTAQDLLDSPRTGSAVWLDPTRALHRCCATWTAARRASARFARAIPTARSPARCAVHLPQAYCLCNIYARHAGRPWRSLQLLHPALHLRPCYVSVCPCCWIGLLSEDCLVSFASLHCYAVTHPALSTRDSPTLLCIWRPSRLPCISHYVSLRQCVGGRAAAGARPALRAHCQRAPAHAAALPGGRAELPASQRASICQARLQCCVCVLC